MKKNSDIPQSVAIIMDGNGRWAQQRGLERVEGHINGVESVRASLRAAVKNGVRYLTLYAFSTENWGRPQPEVDALMELLCKSIVNETPELIEQGVAVKVIGDTTRMNEKVQQHLNSIESSTACGEVLTLILALNYSSRHEITRAAQLIAQAVERKEISTEQITDETVNQNLYTAPYPDPDLVIRTSGECRLSNFLLWQSAYAELYFTEVLWPDFRQEQFDEAIEAYKGRNRRFGLIEQEENN